MSGESETDIPRHRQTKKQSQRQRNRETERENIQTDKESDREEREKKSLLLLKPIGAFVRFLGIYDMITAEDF